VEIAQPETMRPALLDVTVNGETFAEPLMLLQDGTGGLYATAALLAQWRIRRPSSAPVRYEGEDWYRIDNLPSLRATLSGGDQSLAIEAGPSLFERQSTAFGRQDLLEMTPAGTGGFVNYDLFAEYSRGVASLNGALEFGAFTSRGVGSASFVGQTGSGASRLVRLDTSWTIDRPASLSSIRVGDGISSAGTGARPIRFAGLQFARNFSVQPGFITMPLPVLEGSAEVPSIVDIYVNNALQGSQEVRPGPFELTNVPIQSGGGTVQLVMRDLLGRQVVSEQSYYASGEMLRRGLHDFSYQLGFARRGFGLRSNDYGELIASTTHRYGLTDSITLNGHAEAASSVQMAGGGVDIALSNLGTVGASASFSRSDAGTGAFLTASLERRSSGLSFGLRSEYASEAFTSIGGGDELRRPRLTAQAFADMPLFGGAMGINLIHRDYRIGDSESLAGLFTTLRLSRATSVQLFARHAVSGQAQTVFGGHLSFALGGRRSAAATSEYRNGRFTNNISYQADAPAGIGSGYRTSASLGPVKSVETVYTHNIASASFAGHVSNTGGSTGLRLSATGAAGLVGGRPFASRSLGTSFATVEVGRYEGVRVYADNQLVGVTDSSGSVVVPSLRAFDRNVIRIDEGDLPLNVQLAANERVVRPYARSGAVIRFEARRERGVLLQVRLQEGGNLPAGAVVRAAGDPQPYIAVSGGEIYLPSLEGTKELQASWDGRRCSFTVTVQDNDDPQPRIDGLICRSEATYAAR
jgi:outer membrane usher protein